MKKFCYLLLLYVAFASKSTAQVDPHFSQYYANPLWLNPATTGIIDGSSRINANFRTQWGNISNPYQTIAASFDTKTNSNINWGVNLYRQTAGPAVFSITQALGSVSYTGLRWGATGTNLISFGAQVGIKDTRFDQTKFQFGSQYDPVNGFDPSKMGETFNKTSATVLDVNFGLMYVDGNPTHRVNPFVGVSANHLTQPADVFFVSSGQKLPIRYTAHGGVRIALSDVVNIVPNLLYMRQGNADEKVVGAYAQLKVNPTTDILLGANYRFDDAVAAYAGFQYKGFTLGASFDVNASNLHTLVKSPNSIEISLAYIFSKTIHTPNQQFICPRL